MMTTALLLGTLELKTERPVPGEPIWVSMTITNGSDQELVIVNPEVGVPPPDLNWRASNEAYQIGVLMSFGLIQITLKDANGVLVESKGLMPWVTPIFGKRALQPHDSLALDFDLNELFSINLAGLYNVQVRYGKDGVYADASTDLEIMPSQRGLTR
jgi:hypothetical protein